MKSFEELPSIRNILAGLGITEEEYYSALAIFIDTDFQIQLNVNQMHVLLTIILWKVYRHGRQT